MIMVTMGNGNNDNVGDENDDYPASVWNFPGKGSDGEWLLS